MFSSFWSRQEPGLQEVFSLVYRAGHEVSPELRAWRDEWERRTGNPGWAEKAMRNVSAVAHGLGLGDRPADLPANALELYVEIQPIALSTQASYRSALNAWARYRREGFVNRGRSPMSRVPDSGAEVTDPHLRRWVRVMRTNGLAPGTIKSYLRVVLGIAELAEKDPIDLDEDDVMDFIISRRAIQESKGKDLSASRHNGYLAPVRGFCFANRKVDITQFVGRLRRFPERTRPAPEAAVYGLLAAAVQDMASTDAQTADTGRRMWASTRAMSGMGYRISTAVHLMPDDVRVDMDGGWRMHPQFVKARRGQAKPTHPCPEDLAQELLTNWASGETFWPLEVDAQRAGNQWSAWAESKGFPGLTPHMLRVYWIRKLYRLTKDLHGVSRAADHRQAATTEGYLGDEIGPEVEAARRLFDVDVPARVPRQVGNVIPLRALANTGAPT